MMFNTTFTSASFVIVCKESKTQFDYICSYKYLYVQLYFCLFYGV